MRRISDFYDQGGTVIFTTRLPFKSAEFGKDREVTSIIQSIFPRGEKETGSVKENSRGGKAVFLSHPDGPGIREVLNQTVGDFDVEYPVFKNLQYIHKVVDGRNLFFFANTGSSPVKTMVILRGEMKLEEWDPYSGLVNSALTGTEVHRKPALSFTQVKIELPPYRSCFLVEATEEQ